VKRRDFIKVIGGGAVAWPLSARAQQSAMPVLGFLGTGSPEVYAPRLRVFHEGLKEAGYVEGQNIAIEYRWTQGQNDLLPKLAAELVQLRVAVIVAGSGTLGATAAKAATTTIPIVFGVAVDPVEAGLVASLNRPGGNLTGVTNLNIEIGPKRVELLHTLLPTATVFAVLVDPSSFALANDFTRSVQAAARRITGGDHDPPNTYMVFATAFSLIYREFPTNYRIRTMSPLALNKAGLFERRQYISSK
jgi:putative ABC transport system substrate-binding protein